MCFSYKYTEGKQEEAKSLLDRVIAYNKEKGMFNGDILTNYRFTPVEGGYDAIEVFCSAEAATKYYTNFGECPFVQEVMGLAAMVSQTKDSDIIGLAEERNKCAMVEEYYPAGPGADGAFGNTYLEEKPDLSKYGEPAFGWV